MTPKINDGGPAFPRPVSTDEHDQPCNVYQDQDGMSLRDWFAGQALAGLSVGCSGLLGGTFSAYAKGPCNAVLAERAYVLADAMLAAREASRG